MPIAQNPSTHQTPFHPNHHHTPRSITIPPGPSSPHPTHRHLTHSTAHNSQPHGWMVLLFGIKTEVIRTNESFYIFLLTVNFTLPLTAAAALFWVSRYFNHGSSTSHNLIPGYPFQLQILKVQYSLLYVFSHPSIRGCALIRKLKPLIRKLKTLVRKLKPLIRKLKTLVRKPKPLVRKPGKPRIFGN